MQKLIFSTTINLTFISKPGVGCILFVNQSNDFGTELSNRLKDDRDLGGRCVCARTIVGCVT